MLPYVTRQILPSYEIFGLLWDICKNANGMGPMDGSDINT